MKAPTPLWSTSKDAGGIGRIGAIALVVLIWLLGLAFVPRSLVSGDDAQLRAARDGQRLSDATQLRYSLVAYRIDQGGYPRSLDALAPRYLPAVPADPAAGRPVAARECETVLEALVYRYRYTVAADGSRYSLGVCLESGPDRALELTSP